RYKLIDFGCACRPLTRRGPIPISAGLALLAPVQDDRPFLSTHGNLNVRDCLRRKLRFKDFERAGAARVGGVARYSQPTGGCVPECEDAHSGHEHKQDERRLEVHGVSSPVFNGRPLTPTALPASGESGGGEGAAAKQID